MVAAGQLGHHTAISGMQVHLAVERLCQQPLPGVIQGYAGFIAAGFDSQDLHGGKHSGGGRIHQ